MREALPARAAIERLQRVGRGEVRASCSRAAPASLRVARIFSIDVVPTSIGCRRADRPTMVLAHASGEWISSAWWVCPVSESAAPQRSPHLCPSPCAVYSLGITRGDVLDASNLGELTTLPPGSISGDVKKFRSLSRPPPVRNRVVLVLPHSSQHKWRDRLLAELAEIALADPLADKPLCVLQANLTFGVVDDQRVEANSLQPRERPSAYLNANDRQKPAANAASFTYCSPIRRLSGKIFFGDASNIKSSSNN